VPDSHAVTWAPHASLKSASNETAERQNGDMPERHRNSQAQQVIAEFRAHGGRVGGYFADIPLLLLTNTGAKSRQLHTTLGSCPSRSG